VGACILDAHEHRVGHLARTRHPPIVAHLGEDDRARADAELRTVVLADEDTLDKPEGRAQPVDGLAHIRVHEDRDDRR